MVKGVVLKMCSVSNALDQGRLHVPKAGGKTSTEGIFMYVSVPPNGRFWPSDSTIVSVLVS